MHYPLPLLMFVLALVALWFSRFAAGKIGVLRHLLRLAAFLCCGVALLLLQAVPFVAGMVGVSTEEIAAFRVQFEEALRRAGLSMKAASIAMYGREDHGRLRKELAGEGGGVSAVRMRRLGPEFHAVWIELEAQAHQVAITLATTFESAVRVLERAAWLMTVAPRPQSMAMQQEAVCVTRAS